LYGKQEDLQTTEYLAQHILALPVHYGLSQEESAHRWFEQHINIQAGIALFAKVFESQADDPS
jgi:steroid 5-alpha reductase family enzyme